MFIVQPTPIMITGITYGGVRVPPLFSFTGSIKDARRVGKGRRSITHLHMIVIQKLSEWRTFGIEDLQERYCGLIPNKLTPHISSVRKDGKTGDGLTKEGMRVKGNHPLHNLCLAPAE
jgi:hypothetical protein